MLLLLLFLSTCCVPVCVGGFFPPHRGAKRGGSTVQGQICSALLAAHELYLGLGCPTGTPYEYHTLGREERPRRELGMESFGREDSERKWEGGGQNLRKGLENCVRVYNFQLQSVQPHKKKGKGW